jgi:mono/diheme cytochrome c family protein
MWKTPHRPRKGAILLATAALSAAALHSQSVATSDIPLNTGKEIFQAACIGCHGPEGKGMPKTTVGFDAPSTFPDFTDCSGTTPEDNQTWRTIITQGGPGRGFSQIMPSFSEALTPKQIDMVVDYLRAFCSDAGWPRGELNFPRALLTEKAFPEDEVVLTTAVNATGIPGVDDEFVYERRLSKNNQLELSLPFGFQKAASGTWFGGVGDVGAGLKRVLFSSLRTGSIFGVQGNIILPTGNKSHGLGNGVTTFETFASYGQLFPQNYFIQAQGGAQLPRTTDNVPRTAFWRMAFGKMLYEGRGQGRLWTPMVEIVADRDLVSGAKVNWDVLPEFQVTLSRRQHVRFNIGARIPFTNTVDRPVQVVMYMLWDWFDGSIKDGWK